MGTKEAVETNFSDAKILIDFLYIDKERTDSFISQLRNGTLRSVTKTIGTSEGSSLSTKGSIEVVQGTWGKRNESNEKAAEEYDPYHSQIIQLLNDLGIPPLSQLPTSCTGQLVLLQSRIKIQDIESIKSMMPIFTKNAATFGVPQTREAKSMMRIFTDILAQIPNTITLTLEIDGFSVTGTLKSGGLSIAQSDINRTYGTQIPGEWFTLGILDTADSASSSTDISSLDNAIDVMSDSLNQLFQSSVYRIIPILVFRRVQVH